MPFSNKSNIAGYDIEKKPVAPNLLLEWEGGDVSVFIPVIETVPGGYQLSWINDAGLDNPDPVIIRNGTDGTDGADGTDGEDGAPGTTFTPHITQISGGYQLSWTNDSGAQNPQTVNIMNGNADNGVTFTPHLTAVSDGYQLSWTNDGGLPNPETVTILDGIDGSNGTDGSNGITFTPSITEISGGYQLSWTNDGGAQNPQTVNIMNGTNGYTPSVSVTRVSGGVQISVTDGAGTTTETVLDGAAGQPGTNGITFTPSISQITGGYQLSWTNDGGAQNPQTVNIMNGINGQNGAPGADGEDGSVWWFTTSEYYTPNFTFAVSDLTGITGRTPNVGDMILQNVNHHSYVFYIADNSDPNTVLADYYCELTGATGANGTNGTDGVSPVVTVTPITGGNRVDIVSAGGSDSFDVMNGIDGTNGTNGEDGSIWWTTTTYIDSSDPHISISDLTGPSGKTPKVGDYILCQATSSGTVVSTVWRITVVSQVGELLTLTPCGSIKGDSGATGQTGPAGPGVPSGGTAGQFLVKQSSTDYDTAWTTVPSAASASF